MNICKEMNFEQEELISKPISKLYSLQPIGLSTGCVESLTSYITRVAKAHCVKTGSLFSDIFFPYLKKDYMLKGGRGFYTSGHLINGVSNVASEFAKMISVLTGIDAIDRLTLLKFKEVIPTRGLYRAHKAYCPHCYEEMKHKGQEVYEPLSWSIRPVNICLRHQLWLQQLCNNCDSQILMLDSRSKSGYCPKCSHWLGIKNWDKDEVKASEWEIFKAELIEEMLSANLRQSAKKADVQNSLSRLVLQFTEGNVSEFARYIEVPKTTLWGWYSKKNLPTLDDVIRICNKCGVTIAEFYSGNVFREDNMFVIMAKRQKKINVLLTTKPIFEVGREFKQLVNDRVNIKLNVTHMSSKLQCNKKIMYKYFNRICKLQTRLNKYYKTEQKNIRIIKLSAEVAKAFSLILDAGEIPTARKIENKLNRPGLMREKEPREYFEFLTSIVP